jgi:hypothetical protein
MAITIGDTLMTSDQTSHTAGWREHAAADGGGAWVTTRCPGRLLTRNQAITSMVLAEHEAAGNGDSPHAAGWRRELGI